MADLLESHKVARKAETRENFEVAATVLKKVLIEVVGKAN